MVRPTTCRQPTSSAGGGSRPRPRWPEVLSLPAPPSRRLGGEMTSVSSTPGPRICHPSSGTSRRVAAPARQDPPLPLPSSVRGQRWRANPSRRVSGKPGAIQFRAFVMLMLGPAPAYGPSTCWGSRRSAGETRPGQLIENTLLGFPRVSVAKAASAPSEAIAAHSARDQLRTRHSELLTGDDFLQIDDAISGGR